MLNRVFGGSVGIDHSLDERVAGQSVASVESCARTFAERIETVDGRTSVEVHLDAATHIVGCRSHGDVFLCDVDADVKTFLIDVGEVVAGFFGRLVCHVQTHVVESVNLHLLVDGASHDVARSQREPCVIFLHERLAIGQFQDSAVSAHSLGDEIGRMSLSGMMEHGGVELHKLHIGHRSLCTIHHCDAVSGCDDGVRCCLIDSSHASSAHHGDFRKIGVHFLRIRIQHVSAIAIDIRCATCNPGAQVVLSDNLHSKVVLLHLNVGTGANGSHQATLNLGSCVVSMMQNAELRVAALAVQVELTLLVAVEVHPPLHELFNLAGRILHHLFNGIAVADVVARNHRVLDVLLEVVNLEVGDAGHASLCKRRVGLVERSLANHANLALLRASHFQRVAHASHTSTDNQKIVFVNHKRMFVLLWCKNTQNY